MAAASKREPHDRPSRAQVQNACDERAYQPL